MSTPNLICCRVWLMPKVTTTFFTPPLAKFASAPLAVRMEAWCMTFAQPLLDAMSSTGSGWFTTLAVAAVVVAGCEVVAERALHDRLPGVDAADAAPASRCRRCSSRCGHTR